MPHSKALRALAEPHRWSLYQRLRRKSAPIAELAGELPLSRATVTRHLKVLQDAGLVTRHTSGPQTLYCAESTPLDALRAGLDQLGGARQAAGGQTAAPDRPASPEPDDDDEIAAAASQWSKVWPGQDANVYAVTMRLLLMGRHVDRALKETAERHGLQGSELLLLDVINLAPEGVLTPSQLQSRLGVTKGAVTKLLIRLEQQGLISRSASESDRRVSYIRLTPQGCSALQTILERHEYGADHAAAKQLPAEQLAQLAELLRSYHALMNKELLRRSKRKSSARPTSL